MKKLKFLLPLLLLVSCTPTNQVNQISIFAPEGTPSLAFANYYADNQDDYTKFDIKGGSDAVTSAFGSGNYDVIIAPTNLGAKFYNANQKYVLYQTIVWGNLYLASTETLSSLQDIENKTVTVFGANSTPDIVLKTLISKNNLQNVNIEYTDDVATANALLKQGKTQYIISAQPSLTKLQSSMNLNILDLQNEWEQINGTSSYPQASIFFKSSLKGQIDGHLSELVRSVNKTLDNPSKSAENAVEMYDGFEKLGKEILESAIPHCHYAINKNQKEAIEYYFNSMNELGLSNQYGGSLPDENFYYSI